MPTSVGGDGGKGLPPYKQTSNADGTVGRHPHADTGGGYGGKWLPPYKQTSNAEEIVGRHPHADIGGRLWQQGVATLQAERTAPSLTMRKKIASALRADSKG